MRTDVTAYDNPEVSRSATVGMWRGATSAQIVAGTAATVDLSPFADKISMTDNSASVSVRFESEFFDCNNQPRPGDLLGIKVDDQWRSITVVDVIDNFIEERGVRTFTVKGRARTGIGGWRTTSATSPIYPLGTNYQRILDDICKNLMSVETSGYNFPTLDYAVPHTNVQFSGMTPWNMMEEVAFATNKSVFTSVLNVVRLVSKDTLRVANIEIENSRVISFSTSRATQAVGSIKLRWLEPTLKKQYQQAQVLGSEMITAGFFKLKVKRTVYWSEDQTQRAERTYLKIIDSCNNTITGIHVADEDYEEEDPFHGKIILKTSAWVPTLYVVSLIVVLASKSAIPDIAPPSGGPTSPVGRIAHGVALTFMLGIMMSIGTGEYEIWGEPYDYVHATNVDVARADNLPHHSMSEVSHESSLITSSGHAQDTVVSALLMESAKSYGMGVTIIDDPRIEVGDIIQFEDGSRVLVDSFSNDFSRGAAATMSVKGFLL